MDTVVVLGQESTVAGLVGRRIGPAYRLARAILLDDQEAEDAVQDACLTAWRRRGSLRDPSSFDAWFDRILINGCRDRLRARQRQRVRAIALQEEWRTRSTPEGTEPDDPALDAALDALDVDHRIVVLLRYWQDLTLDDIATRLGVPLGTVKSRHHHAMQTLRASMEASRGRS